MGNTISEARIPKPASILATAEQVYVPDRKAWRKWLAKHGTKSPGIWLVYDKKTSRAERLAYADAVEEALCYGWIDSTVRPLDEHRYMQFFAPRKPKSTWSRLNKTRIARLLEEKQVAKPGLASIEVAKQNGSWESIDGVEAFEMPPELVKALAKDPAAKAFFDSVSMTTRKGYLFRLNSAKRPETKAARLKEVMDLCRAGLRHRTEVGRPRKAKA